MTMIDIADSRFAKAVAIADQAAQWFRCQTANGKRYGVQSSRDPNHYYLVDQRNCTCEDTKRHPDLVCKHRIAVLIHVARVAGTPMPASDVVDGLEQMVADRHPVLDMVRHPDGEITWERPSRPSLPAATIALAVKYDAIMSRFERA